MIRIAMPRKSGQATVLLTAAALLAVLLVVLFATKPAEAAFPGANGQIAYSGYRQGDSDYEIYAINPNGTGHRALTSSPSWERMPRYSANGAKIVFVSGRADNAGDIYIMNSDGTSETRLTKYLGADHGASFSPDGRKIVFYSNRGGDGVNQSPDPDNEIWTMNVNGTGLKRLTNNNVSDGFPVWSPDGSKIMFRSRRVDTNGELWIMNSDGTGQKRLTSGPGYEYAGEFSPNGRQIVFERIGVNQSTSIFLMKAAPESSTNVPKAIKPDDGFGSDAYYPSFSPDGKKIVFTRNMLSTEGTLEVLKTMNLDGTDTTTVLSQQGQSRWYFQYEANWQPR